MEIDFHFRKPVNADTLLHAKTFYADPITWPLRQSPHIFLQREIINSSYPFEGQATMDLRDIDSVRIDGGKLLLGSDEFEGWDDGNAEPGWDPEIHWFLIGERIPHIEKALFEPPSEISVSDWHKLLFDCRFTRDHTKSPLANSIPLACGLSNKDEFISWLTHFPTELVQQLPILPSTLEWITRRKKLLGIP